MEEGKPISPIRRSGSPLRRRQIATLEQSGKKPRLEPLDGEKFEYGNLEFGRAGESEKGDSKESESKDSEPKDSEILAKMASSIDTVATAFAATASQMRDTRATQKNILDELLAIRIAMEKLQSDMETLKRGTDKS